MADAVKEMDITITQDKSRPKVYIKTFGCQMNEYDSEKILAVLSPHYEPATDFNDAELIIINTCSVREKGEHKLFSLLGTLRERKQKTPKLIIGVGGCVAQQEGEAILKREKSVDFVVGTHNISLIPSLVKLVKEGRPRQVAIDYRDGWEDLPSLPILTDDKANEDHVSSEELASNFALFSETTFLETPARALVAIQRGCNKNCSFCVIPKTRGPEVSRDPEEILREVKLKAKMGAREVLLLGQTVNSYGRDLLPKYPFEKLVNKIAEIEGISRIRFTSPHPQEVRREFIKLFGENQKLCPHIHLPLQSGSDRILKLMNRNYRLDRYIKIIDELRQVCPDIAITTDLIVGFPTETDEDFEETLGIVSQIRYHSCYAFKYSLRPNTKDIKRFFDKDLIQAKLQDKRLSLLLSLQEGISREINEKLLGTSVQVLVEGQSSHISSYLRGRSPEGSWVEVCSETPVRIGEIVNVIIDHAGPYGLRGRNSHP